MGSPRESMSSTAIPPCHGAARVTYWTGNIFLGDRRQYCALSGEHSCYYPNRIFFCPVCGDVWAREVWQFEFPYSPRPHLPSWVSESSPCEAHGGGLLLPDTLGDPSSYSPQLLRRESLVLIRQTERIPPQAALQHLPSPEPQAQRLVSARQKFPPQTP